MNNHGWRHPALWIAVSALALLVLIGIGFAVLDFFGPRTPMGYYYPFFPFGLFWGIFLIFIIFGAFRWMFWGWRWGYRRSWRYYDSAHQILRERYAKGEITKEQYDQMSRDLEQQG
jgi:uncharacterized membrane protein